MKKFSFKSALFQAFGLSVLVLGLFVSTKLVGEKTNFQNRASVECGNVSLSSCSSTQGCTTQNFTCDGFSINQCPSPACFVYTQTTMDGCTTLGELNCAGTLGCTVNKSVAYCDGRTAGDRSYCRPLSQSACGDYRNAKKCVWNPVHFVSCTGDATYKYCKKNPNNQTQPQRCVYCTVQGTSNTVGCKNNQVVRYSANGCNFTVLQNCSTLNKTCSAPDAYSTQYYCR
jgi:hypothetical protein